MIKDKRKPVLSLYMIPLEALDEDWDSTYCGGLLQISLWRGGGEGADGTEGGRAVRTGDIFRIRDIQHLKSKTHTKCIFISSHMHTTNAIFPSNIKRANETGKTQADMLFDMIYISVFRLDLVNIINFLH